MSSVASRQLDGTAAQILDVAERLAQTRGFNGFSYADIAAELGITKASLHYHYASKADLGRALIDRYTASFGQALAAIAASGDAAPLQLERYAAIYAQVLEAGRICLCGMLAAEYTTLPAPMQDAIRAFFDANEQWLSAVLDAGRETGSLSFDGEPRDAARSLTAGLEGAMLLTRPYADHARFVEAAARLLRDLVTPPAGAASRRTSGPARGATARTSRTPDRSARRR